MGSVTDFPVVTPEELKRMQCTKVVFLLLDFLDQWLREWQWQKGLTGVSHEHFQTVRVSIYGMPHKIKLSQTYL